MQMVATARQWDITPLGHDAIAATNRTRAAPHSYGARILAQGREGKGAYQRHNPAAAFFFAVV